MENEVEIWKDVVGYEGLYEVSDMGRVRSLRFWKAKVLKYVVNIHGYLQLGLRKEYITKNVSVHSLVAKSFIDPDYRKNGLVVNHKDFNRQNNILSNLEIVTPRKNSNKIHLLSSSKYTGVCLRNGKWKSTIVIGRKVLYLGIFDTEIEASKYYEAALICINEGRIDDIVRKVREPKGYYLHKQSNKLKAYVHENGKQKYLGHYKTEEEARLAVKKHCDIDG